MRMVLDIADVLGPESLETSDRYVGALEAMGDTVTVTQ